MKIFRIFHCILQILCKTVKNSKIFSVLFSEKNCKENLNIFSVFIDTKTLAFIQCERRIRKDDIHTLPVKFDLQSPNAEENNVSVTSNMRRGNIL